VWLLSTIFLAFLAGVATAHYRLWPYAPLRTAVQSGRELASDWRGYLGFRPSRLLLHPFRGSNAGTTTYRRGEAADGLTLISGLFDNRIGIVLVGMDGTVVNRWVPDFYKIFPSPDHVLPKKDRPRSRWGYAIHGATAFEDGSVLFNFEYLGMVKMDRCGSILWTLPQMTHHLFSESDDGSLWVLSRRYRRTNPDGLGSMRVPFFDDTILQVTSDGRVTREIGFLAVIAKAGLTGLLADPGVFHPALGGGFKSDDPTHLNDVEVFSRETAVPALGIREGDLLVSSRQLNLLLAFDPVTLETRWWQAGPWLRQHDPDILPGGRVSVFNNSTAFGPSNVMTVDLASRQTTTLHAGKGNVSFYSAAMGTHQFLSNGNVLITEPEGGRVLEVSPAGEIVWEYVNRYDSSTVADISVATRYEPGFFRVTDWTCSR
jgi:hypothetical protein